MTPRIEIVPFRSRRSDRAGIVMLPGLVVRATRVVFSSNRPDAVMWRIPKMSTSSETFRSSARPGLPSL
jgi:hypothetical protein